jgi:hypothetical protein
VRALLGRLRPAHRPPSRQGAAPPRRRRPGGATRSGTATRAGGASSTPPPTPGFTTPLVRDARTGEAARGELAGGAAGGRRGAARARDGRYGVAVLTGGGSPSRMPSRTRSSPGPRCTPTTSTSGPADRAVLTPRTGRGGLPGLAGGRRTRLRTRGLLRRWCWSPGARGRVPDPVPAAAQGPHKRRLRCTRWRRCARPAWRSSART